MLTLRSGKTESRKAMETIPTHRLTLTKPVRRKREDRKPKGNGDPTTVNRVLLPVGARSGKTESRKAMETWRFFTHLSNFPNEAGRKKAERQWRQSFADSAFAHFAPGEAGRQKAERQWRPYDRPGHTAASQTRSGKTESRKAME